MNDPIKSDSHDGAVVLPRLVLPRRHGLRHKHLSAHLDAIYSATDAAIHKGYCGRNVRKLDSALVRIIAEAEAARNLIRQNSD